MATEWSNDWIFKLGAIAGFVYLIYVFIKDRRGKK